MNSVDYSVRCPKCSGEATARIRPVGTKGTYREVLFRMGAGRIVCPACGFSREVSPGNSQRYELWYAMTFKGHRLWACNRQHLTFLISWFSGNIREQDLSFGDRTLVEALPKWMVLRKHREGILQCLNQMLLLTQPVNKRIRRTGA